MDFIQSRETRDHGNYPNLRIYDNEYPNDRLNRALKHLL